MARDDHFVAFKENELSVGDLTRTLMPRGAAVGMHLGFDGKGELQNVQIGPFAPRGGDPWKEAPPLPQDVFGITGLLLDLSGAAHHVCEVPHASWGRPLVFGAEEREPAILAGEKWAELALEIESTTEVRFVAPRAIQIQWAKLWKAKDEPIFTRLPTTGAVPDWWRAALFLFIAADTAALGLGYPEKAYRIVDDAEVRKHRVRITQAFNSFFTVGTDVGAVSPDGSPLHMRESIATLRQDLLCVMPKARTPQVGSTLRSLSQNLGLLPSRGLARATWHLWPFYDGTRSDSEPLNLLLVPFPYQIQPSHFHADLSEHSDDRPWSWLELDTNWPPKATPQQFCDFLYSLVKVASKKTGKVHGIILPESAISYETFRYIQNQIRLTIRPDDPWFALDFIVAGVTEDNRGRPGNFAATAVFYRPEGADGVPEVRSISNVQEKHHRWRIDRSQVKHYGLGSSFSAGKR